MSGWAKFDPALGALQAAADGMLETPRPVPLPFMPTRLAIDPKGYVAS